MTPRIAALRLLLPGLALAWATLGTSCSNPTYQTYRTPAPGGGYYVRHVAVPAVKKMATRGFLGLKSTSSNVLAKVTRPSDGSYWHADHMHGNPSIRIVLSQQKIYFYKGGQLAGASPISSGKEGYDTRPGKFSVIQKDIDHKSSVYGWYVRDGEVLNDDVDIRKDPKPPGAKFDPAEMPYFMRIVGGIGMHAGNLPGYAASHGCIRLPRHMAERFYHASPLGTPVTIVN